MQKHQTKKLFHRAKKEFIGPNTMKYCLSQHNKTDYIGFLPPEIITKIPENKRSETTKNADKILSNFAHNISSFARYYDFQDIEKTSVQDIFTHFEQQMTKLLGLEKVTLDYIGHGAYKYCFRLKFGLSNNAYALQIFKDFYGNKSPDSGTTHGALFEPQNYFFVYNKYSHRRVARPFIAKPVTESTSTHAYILAKYIDKSEHTIKTESRPFSIAREPMFSDDKNVNNIINKKIIDVGNYKHNPKHIANKELRTHWSEFAQILDNMDFYSNNAYVTSRFLLKKYKEKGILFFDTKLWPEFLDETKPEYREQTRKMLRSLHRLYTKRNIMESVGIYEEIKNILHQDFIRHFDFLYVNKDMPYDKNIFYPEIVCEILDINNVPPLESIATRCKFKQPMVLVRGKNRIHWNKNRIHWNKYYTKRTVIECMKKHPYGLDWEYVIKDFKSENFIQKILQKIKTK